MQIESATGRLECITLHGRNPPASQPPPFFKVVAYLALRDALEGLAMERCVGQINLE